MARRNEHTKDQLKYLALKSAYRIIKEEGIEKLSTRKIAKEIGYVPGTLYNIFKNSDDILLHINSQTMLEITEIFTKELNDYNTIALEGIIVEYLGYIEKNYKLWCCLFEYKQSSESPLPEWYTEYLDFIIAGIEKCLAEKYTDAETIKQSAETIWTAVNGICFIGLTSANKNSDFAHMRNMCINFVKNYLK